MKGLVVDKSASIWKLSSKSSLSSSSLLWSNIITFCHSLFQYVFTMYMIIKKKSFVKNNDMKILCHIIPKPTSFGNNSVYVSCFNVVHFSPLYPRHRVTVQCIKCSVPANISSLKCSVSQWCHYNRTDQCPRQYMSVKK